MLDFLKKISWPLLWLFIIALPFACDKDSRHPVPIVPVDFTINVESTQHIELNNIGGWAYYTGGYRGIIIYRQSVDEFRAFDRACPYHPHDDCAIVRVYDPPVAKDTCCGSRFLLIDGSVVTGPAQHPLREYRTYYNHPYLQVTN